MSSLQDVYVIDASKPDTVMWVDSALTYGDVGIKSVADMVSTVQALAKKKKVRELRIMGHGNVYGQWVGSDWLSLATLPTHRPELLKLVHCFGSGGFITMAGCEQGNNGGFLLEISNITGVPVQGFTAMQRPTLPGDEGGVTRCFITCARGPTTGSDTFDKILGQGSRW